VTSRLLELPGIGPKRRRALLTAFGSLEGVRAASPEAIAAIPGFSVVSAARLLDALRDAAAGVPTTSPAAATTTTTAPPSDDTPTPES
jgi:excinuclease ABC subunit C